MLSQLTILSFLLLTVSFANASPVIVQANTISLKFARQIDTLNSSVTLLDRDRARASGWAHGRGKSIQATSEASFGYTAQVSVGTPSTQCESRSLFVGFVGEDSL
jgi:hypothetical protein